MYLPIRERVHVMGVSMGFLEICRYLYCHMAVYDLIIMTRRESMRRFSSDRQLRLSSIFETLL